MKRGDYVEIKAGDEIGGWGTVALVVSRDEIHVALYTLDPDAPGTDRVYARDEIKRPRNQDTMKNLHRA